MISLGPAMPYDGKSSAESVVFIGSQGAFREDESGQAEVPKDMPGVKGVFLGGCIGTGIGRISDHTRCELAHAHIDGVYQGWICFQLPEYLHGAKYRWLRMHEFAHIISGEGHTKKWRQAMGDLGQEIPDKYRPRRRKNK